MILVLKRSKWILLFILTLSLAGCGTLIPTPTPTPTSTPTLTPSPTASSTQTPLPTDTPQPTNTPTITPTPSPYDGDWEGTTSAGLPVLFTVSFGVVSNVELSCEFDAGGLSAVISMSPPGLSGPVVNEGFLLDVLALIFRGTFSSGTSASGTIELKPDTGAELCSGSAATVDWNATKK